MQLEGISGMVKITLSMHNLKQCDCPIYYKMIVFNYWTKDKV